MRNFFPRLAPLAAVLLLVCILAANYVPTEYGMVRWASAWWPPQARTSPG